MPLSTSRIYLVIFIALTIFAMTAGNSLAENKFIIKPYMDLEAGYESNYWRAEKDGRGVYVSSAKPGITLGYTTAKSRLIADYTLEAFWYRDATDPPDGGIDAEDLDYIGHDFQVLAETQPSDRLSIGLEDSYIITRDPANSDIYSNEIYRFKYTINRLIPQVIYEFNNTFRINLEYMNTIIDYSESEHEDAVEDRGVLDLTYNLNRYTSIDLEIQAWDRNYELSTSDYQSLQFMLNLNKEYKFFTVFLGGGYHNREFDDPGVAGMNIIAWSIGISGQNPPRLDAGQKKSKTLLKFDTQKIMSYMRAELSHNMNDTTYLGGYHEATRLEVEAGHRFFTKLNLGMGSFLQKSRYKHTDEKRSDESFGLYALIDYALTDNITLSLKGGREARDSTVEGHGYTNDFLTFSVRFHRKKQP